MKLLKYRYLPLTAYTAYAAFVVCCLVFGPVQFEGLGYAVLLGFLALYVMLFAFGYIAGARGNFDAGVDVRSLSAVAAYVRTRRLFTALLLIASIYSAYAWVELFLSGGFRGFSSIGETYSEYYAGYERGQATISPSYILSIFIQAVVTLSILFGIAHFRSMDSVRRIAVVFVIVSYVLVNLLMAGKQKYIGDVAVFLASAIAISMAARKVRVSVSRVLMVSVMLLATFAILVEILRQRYSFRGIGIDSIASMSHPRVIWDVNTPLVDVFGPDYGFAIGAVLFYFSNGLYGLYLCLTLPFEWSYLVGNSYSIGRIAEIIVGQPGAVLTQTYPYRAGEVYGWGLEKWHSAFAWFASDIGFVGVLVFTPLFARFYARLWKEAVNGANAVAAPLFLYLSLGLAFSFANNQLVHSLSGVIVLGSMLLLRRAELRRPNRNAGVARPFGD